MKWETQRINKKFFGNLRKHLPGRFTNDMAYRLYWEHHATVSLKGHVVRAAEHFGHDPNENYKWDSMMTMNVRNQLCVLAHHGFLTRIEPGVYEWTPTLMDDRAYLRRIDWINEQVGLRKAERDALYREARVEAQRIYAETGKHVSSWDIFQRYREEGR